jgi:hypothetical protein
VVSASGWFQSHIGVVSCVLVPRLLHHTLRSRVIRLLNLFGILSIKVALLAECWGARVALLLGAQGMNHIGAPIPTTLTTTAKCVACDRICR